MTFTTVCIISSQETEASLGGRFSGAQENMTLKPVKSPACHVYREGDKLFVCLPHVPLTGIPFTTSLLEHLPKIPPSCCYLVLLQISF